MNLAAVALGLLLLATASPSPRRGVEFTIRLDPPIQAMAIRWGGAEGARLQGPVAVFSDPDRAASITDYRAAVTWDDGTVSQGDISRVRGLFVVVAAHTFPEEGSHSFRVAITDTDGAVSVVAGEAVISDAPLRIVDSNLESSGLRTQLTVVFRDSNPAPTGSDYSLSVDWGDRNASVAGAAASAANFSAQASHTYQRPGAYRVVATLKDLGGALATLHANVRVRVAATL